MPSAAMAGGGLCAVCRCNPRRRPPGTARFSRPRRWFSQQLPSDAQLERASADKYGGAGAEWRTRSLLSSSVSYLSTLALLSRPLRQVWPSSVAPIFTRRGGSATGEWRLSGAKSSSAFFSYLQSSTCNTSRRLFAEHAPCASFLTRGRNRRVAWRAAACNSPRVRLSCAVGPSVGGQWYEEVLSGRRRPTRATEPAPV